MAVLAPRALRLVINAGSVQTSLASDALRLVVYTDSELTILASRALRLAIDADSVHTSLASRALRLVIYAGSVQTSLASNALRLAIDADAAHTILTSRALRLVVYADSELTILASRALRLAIYADTGHTSLTPDAVRLAIDADAVHTILASAARPAAPAAAVVVTILSGAIRYAVRAVRAKDTAGGSVLGAVCLVEYLKTRGRRHIAGERNAEQIPYPAAQTGAGRRDRGHVKLQTAETRGSVDLARVGRAAPTRADDAEAALGAQVHNEVTQPRATESASLVGEGRVGSVEEPDTADQLELEFRQVARLLGHARGAVPRQRTVAVLIASRGPTEIGVGTYFFVDGRVVVETRSG